MRRIIKPFIVEVRSSKRKPSSITSLELVQPRVEWPAALLAELRADPVVAPAKPPRRILPALDEQPKVEIAAAPERVKRLPRIKPKPEELLPVTPEAADAAPVREMSAPRQPRVRIPRAAFIRGERWKARLPASVHRTSRKGHRLR